MLSSASLHDSQVAIPLLQMAARRVTSLYDLMDSAYYVEEIGIPALDVLTWATRNGAQVLGRGDELGTVSVGKLADLLGD